MKIVAIVGSLRKESFNMQLARTIQERYEEKFELVIPNIGELPHFNQDDELDPVPVVKEFKQLVKEADGVMLITPEYNWSIPGVLKNALDWLSRVDKVLTDKPVMIAGASAGMMGTIRGQLQLRQALTSPGLQARLLPPAGNEILINKAGDKFDGNRLVDESTLAFLDKVVDQFIEFIQA